MIKLILLFFLKKINFCENSFKKTIIVTNSLDPDQVRHFVGPDLAQNCLQWLSADNTSRQKKVKIVCVLTHLRRMEFSIFINWPSPFVRWCFSLFF